MLAQEIVGSDVDHLELDHIVVFEMHLIVWQRRPAVALSIVGDVLMSVLPSVGARLTGCELSAAAECCRGVLLFEAGASIPLLHVALQLDEVARRLEMSG